MNTLKKYKTKESLLNINLGNVKKYEFFQLIRLLEKYINHGAVTEIFFSVNYNLCFSPTSVEALEIVDDSPNHVSSNVLINFMGLVGTHGALPPPHTECIAELIRNKDHRMLNFFNIFQNRSIFLFYQAWKKYNYNINFEQAYWNNTSTPRTQLLPSIIGINQLKANTPDFFPDNVALFYAAHFSRQQHSANALEQILGDYLQIPVKLQQLIDERFNLKSDDLTYLSKSSTANNALGISTNLGQQIWLSQQKFRIQLGPLSAEQFHYFLPRSSNGLRKLCAIVRKYADNHLSFDVQPIIKSDEISPLKLGQAKPFQLGWNSWTHSNNFNFEYDKLFISEDRATNSP
jgi:type VI secretion system protein ImpH